MVSKLKFKGDKKKKKRDIDENDDLDDGTELKKAKKTNSPIAVAQIRDEDLMMINNKLTDINSMKLELFDEGWSTANTVGDLNGPAIIIPEQEEEEEEGNDKAAAIMAMAMTEDGDKIEVSKNLSIDDEAINFNGYDDDSIGQKIIPNDSKQVFVLTNVMQLISKKSEKLDKDKVKSGSGDSSIKLSLKTRDKKFITVNDHDDIRCDSNVMTENEIFEFVRVRTRRSGKEDNENEKVRWQIKTNDGRKLYLLSNGQFKAIKDDDDVLDQNFIIRVQIRNTVNSKKIKLLKKQTNSTI